MVLDLPVNYLDNENLSFEDIEPVADGVIKLGLHIKIIARHISFFEISYALVVQNLTENIIENLTLFAAFQDVSNFEYDYFVDDYKPHGREVTTAYIDILDANCTCVCALNLKTRLFPPLLATISTKTNVQPSYVSSLEKCFETLLNNYRRDKQQIVDVLKMEYSYIVTHLDTIITYDVFEDLCLNFSKDQLPRITFASNKECLSCTNVPISLAKQIWSNINPKFVFASLIPSAPRNYLFYTGYILVRDVFVEVKFEVEVTNDMFKLKLTTPYEELNEHLREELHTKCHSLLLFGNHSPPSRLKSLDYSEEKEMMEMGIALYANNDEHWLPKS